MKHLSLVLFFALGGCVTHHSQHPMTVQQVVQEARTLDGQEVVVTGWLQECRRLSCPLYASAEEAEKEQPSFLSIGPSVWFDPLSLHLARTRITLRARFNSRCVSDPASGVIAVCTDRPASLEPIRMIR